MKDDPGKLHSQHPKINFSCEAPRRPLNLDLTSKLFGKGMNAKNDDVVDGLRILDFISDIDVARSDI